MAKSGSKKSGGSGIIVGVIVVVAILAIAGGAAWFFLLRSTPEQVVAKFMAAGTEGKGEAAKACLCEASAKDWDKMAQFFQAAKPYTVGKTTKTSDSATTIVSIPAPAQMKAVPALASKTTLDVQMATVKEKGKWKVDTAKTMQATIQAVMTSAMGGGMPGGAPGGAPK